MPSMTFPHEATGSVKEMHASSYKIEVPAKIKESVGTFLKAVNSAEFICTATIALGVAMYLLRMPGEIDVLHTGIKDMLIDNTPIRLLRQEDRLRASFERKSS